MNVNAKRHKNAIAAARQLVYAFERGEVRGGSVDWSDVELAVEFARDAIGEREYRNIRKNLLLPLDEEVT